ncbi:Di-copper centre-containing protein [Mytilinidion resinicola]|uniref:tyrosinase n=1 Tax=Mytilinidion resinicola TaxID=574789 RepID=A0A6A6YIB0_9PEZI|nr:Di-copper centre-containing protein [Mytilinidion resinicola]KAF2808582.1 Di-copper centre-containing protein [Mytilinidion resinicola]
MHRQRLRIRTDILAKLSIVIWLAGLLLLAGHLPGTHGKPFIGSAKGPERLLEARGPHRRTPNSSHYVITGAPVVRTASGAVPIRRDIRDLHDNHADLFNLYILGLRDFYAADENDDLSFYKIAGIHGRPYGPWQGAEGISGKDAGFCPHSNILFLTWHRAYLLLYEQLLHKHVADVASKFIPELRQRYVQAAQDFRIPYWDWSASIDNPDHPIPTYIAEDAEILVTETDGTQQLVDNPLHHFEFHPCEPVPETFDGKWQGWTTTLRHPSSDDANATSRAALFISHFTDWSGQLHNDVGFDMLQNQSFNTYSKSHLELTHNLVHNIAGGGMDSDEDRFWGHMDPLDYSAFDPVFWLHHANVDHILALYQPLHPARWLHPDNIAASGTYAIPDYSTVDAATPLSPFWNSQGGFFTSNDLRDTIPLGYAYPETQRWLFATDGAFQDSVARAVGVAYSPDWRALVADPAAMRTGPVGLVERGVVTAWAVRVGVDKGAVGGSFGIRILLEGREVGRVAVLMPEGLEARGMVVNATVELTRALVGEVGEGRLRDLGEEAVGGYLQGRLGWRVDAISGGQVQATAPREVGLEEVVVVSNEVTVPLDPEMPLVYSGTWVKHPEIVVSGVGGV